MKQQDNKWSGKIVGFSIFIIISTIICIVLANKYMSNDGDYITNSNIKYHKNSIVVKTLAKIPPGPFVHRFIDFDLEKICYLNGAGGGIWCESLATALVGLTPEAIDDILTTLQHTAYGSNVSKSSPDIMQYYPEGYELQAPSYATKRQRAKKLYNRGKTSGYRTD